MKPKLSCYRWTILGAAMIAAVALIVYKPGLRIGFWTDDYSFLETAGRLNFVDYWISYLDPRLQWHWYRPMQGLYWWIGYAMFRGDPTGYHLMQLGLHIANAILLFGLTKRVARRWQLALVAALVYLTLSVDSLAVLWVGVADPLVAVFYLLTIALWLNYLETTQRRWFALAFVAFVGALLSKEIGATLAVTLFLADRLLVRQSVSLIGLVRRYALFAGVLLIYGLLELNVLTRGVFTGSLGYGIGGHILSALVHHLKTLSFPWGLPAPMDSIGLLIVLGLTGFAAFKREWRIIFLMTTMILTLLPVLPFPPGLAFASRYLYLPLMGSAVGVAFVSEAAARLSGAWNRRWVGWAASFAVALLIVWNSAVISESAVAFDGTVRQARLHFRPIFQSYSSFEPDTFLYFINPPLESPYISGLFFLRYGANIVVDGSDRDHPARLRDHNTAIVFYQDDAQNWRKQMVEKNAAANATPKLAVIFGSSISLDEFELASANVKRGDVIVLILYWRAPQRIDRDYTVFIHLVDSSGKMVTGYDATPRQGAAPTSQWRVNELVTDGIVMPIDAAIVSGDYDLQVGLYDPATLQRLSILDSTGQPTTDMVVIGPVHIGE